MTAQLPIQKERLEKIASWREKYGVGHNVMLPAEEAEALARFALAAYEQEPVADVVAWSHPQHPQQTCNIRWRRFDVAPGPLYTHPAPVPAVPDEVLSRLEHEANHITEWHHMDEHSCKVNRRDLLTLVNACRAAMLNGGKS